MELYVAALGFGLISASVIAIAAVGFTMQFGITNMINLAYGDDQKIFPRSPRLSFERACQVV